MSDTPTSMAERWRRSQLEAIEGRAEEREATTRAEAAPQGDTPARCPSCRSTDILTTSKVVTAEAYWRCCACGEVWNAARLRAGSNQARLRR